VVMIKDNLTFFNVFSILHKEDVRYVIWKGSKAIRDQTKASDIDILVWPSHRAKLVGCLYENNYIFIELDRPHPFQEHYANLITEEIVHVHYRAVVGVDRSNYVLDIEKVCLENRVFSEEYNCYFVSVNLEHLINFAVGLLENAHASLLKKVFRALFKSRAFSEKRDDRLSYLSGRNDRIALIVDQTLLLDTQIDISVNTFTFAERLKLIFLNKRFLNNFVKLTNDKQVTTSLNRGISLAIIGIDGAGKSTLSNNIANHLNKFMTSERMYLGMYRGASSWMLRKAMRVFEKVCGVEKAAKYKLYNLIENIRWMVIANAKLKTFQESQRLNLLGVNTIFDRYPLKELWSMDEPMDGPAILNKKNDPLNSLNKIMGKYEREIFEQILAPDMFICLDVSLTTASSRHTDSDENLAPKYVAFQNMLMSNSYKNFNIIDVDSTSLEEVNRLVLKKIDETLV
jgi:hypothetical protein